MDSFDSEDKRILFELEDVDSLSITKPTMCKWFKEKELKVLEVSSGSKFAVLKVKDKDNKLFFYTFVTDVVDKTYYGGSESLISEYKDFISRLDIVAENVASFACTLYATFLLMSGEKDKEPSIDPENPDASGLIHFYQIDHPEKEIDGKKVK